VESRERYNEKGETSLLLEHGEQSII